MKTVSIMPPDQWLKFNYGISIGDSLKDKHADKIVSGVKKTDNVGHFRTDYPVVIGIGSEWFTIEELFGY